MTTINSDKKIANIENKSVWSAPAIAKLNISRTLSGSGGVVADGFKVATATTFQ